MTDKHTFAASNLGKSPLFQTNTVLWYTGFKPDVFPGSVIIAGFLSVSRVQRGKLARGSC